MLRHALMFICYEKHKHKHVIQIVHCASTPVLS